MRVTPDGKGILYQRFTSFAWTRPRYQGSGASQLWRYDLATGKRTAVADTGFQHLWPGLTGAGRMLCVTVAQLPLAAPLNGGTRGDKQPHLILRTRPLAPGRTG